MEMNFKLEVFEGPLDLLLHLISKHKLNIYDIEITLLLEQYLDYMDKLGDNIEVAGEFLEMAARLIYMKSVSLLPRHDEADELKRELSGALIEYALCKQAATRLRDGFAGYDIYVREQVKLEIDRTYNSIHEPQELLAAYCAAVGNQSRKIPLKAEIFRPLVSVKFVSVTSKIIYILRKMYKNERVHMRELYTGMKEHSEKVATFLAVLELSKSGRILISDDNNYIDSCVNARSNAHFDKSSERNVYTDAD